MHSLDGMLECIPVFSTQAQNIYFLFYSFTARVSFFLISNHYNKFIYVLITDCNRNLKFFSNPYCSYYCYCYLSYFSVHNTAATTFKYLLKGKEYEIPRF